MAAKQCNAQLQVGSELPWRVNGTYLCGVNPYQISLTDLQSCCDGSVTNITTPAPKTGAYSSSWPVTCLAYCAIDLHPKYDGVTDEATLRVFEKCVNGFGVYTWVCTEANGLGPDECHPGEEIDGCTDHWSGKTYSKSGYLPLGTSTSMAATATATAGSEAVTTTAQAASPTSTSSAIRLTSATRFSWKTNAVLAVLVFGWLLQ
jgi:hypothetical protein